MARIKASKLIRLLIALIVKHGDKECYMCTDCRGLARDDIIYDDIDDEFRVT